MLMAAPDPDELAGVGVLRRAFGREPLGAGRDRGEVEGVRLRLRGNRAGNRAGIRDRR